MFQKNVGPGLLCLIAATPLITQRLTASVKGNLITVSFSVNRQSVTFVTTRETVAMSTPKISPIIWINAQDARKRNVRRICCRTVRAFFRRVGLRSDGSNSRTSLSILSEENLYLRCTSSSVKSVYCRSIRLNCRSLRCLTK
ncbi:hypothetical protein DPMN_082388 [Dreissena polymorpha]|uniref:Uncharacterized protein n=1 Tax=Dreissena polymorpha TaxID=45954 RepID=A0A9D4BH96_DREPO|nr:hypothetical protein DPMN_082388 [Dreissena polymorpha]